MTFGYEYGPSSGDDSDADTLDEDDIELLPPDHPASVQRCDHGNCQRETPDRGQRICERCDPIMLAGHNDTCSGCGASISD